MRFAFFSSTLSLIPLSSIVPGIGYFLQLPVMTLITIVSGSGFAALYMLVYLGYNFQSFVNVFYTVTQLPITHIVPTPGLVIGFTFDMFLSTLFFVLAARHFAKHPNEKIRPLVRALNTIKRRYK